MIKELFIKVTKRTYIYPFLLLLLKVRARAKMAKEGLIKSFFTSKVVRNELEKILKKSKVRNIGVSPFFYSLDEKIVVYSKNRIIDNMPVDYSVINQNISESNIAKELNFWVKKINDSRINLEEPKNLEEALQKILFWDSLLWQTGHKHVGLGRLDKMLSNYVVPDNAEELIKSFMQNLHCCYSYKSSCFLGDTGQIIVIGGCEPDGSYFCNQYSYIIIRCLKDLHLPDPKVLLRCSSAMPKDLLELATDCISTGIGSPIISNDDTIIPLLIDFGYDSDDAYNYGVSACWEPLSIGNSLEQNNLAHIEFGKYMADLLISKRLTSCKSFDDVLNEYNKILSKGCDEIKEQLDSFEWEKDILLTSMMGLKKDISEGGAKYNNYGILSVGMSSAVNSLLNIKRLVFEEKKYSLNEIRQIIMCDYQNCREDFTRIDNGFGVDCQESIEITNYLIKASENCFKNYRNIFGGKVKFGLSSFSYLDSGKNVTATFDGRKRGLPFSTHISNDSNSSYTEIMNFVSDLHFSGISSNANVIDFMVSPSLIHDNIDKFASLIYGGIKQGLFQLQINVLSYNQLVEAKAHPEKYPNLIVRVWGFSAYFNDLPEEYKDNLIRRAKEMERGL